MLVRLSLDETCGVGRLRHDVVRGGGVAYNTIRPQLSTLSLPGTLVLLWYYSGLWYVLLWYVLLWTLVCTTLVCTTLVCTTLVCTTLDSGMYYSGRHDHMTTGGTVSRMDGRTEGGGRWMGRWKERD